MSEWENSEPPPNTPDGAARGWMRAQQRAARPGVLLAAGLGLAGTAAAVAQAWCAGLALRSALVATGFAGLASALAGFGLLALVRAACGVLADRAAFETGAGARRRLRSTAMERILEAGPALLHNRHSAELAAIAVDRVEAVDGLFSRWLPAAMLAVAAPLLVFVVVLAVDPMAGLILGGAGLIVPLAQALAGIGAARAARRQFLALTRLQARFLDRVRGIATLIMHGRAEDEAVALGVAADELRRRTLKVLRVAFLSSVALDLAMALALILIALRYGEQATAGALADPGRALFVLLLVAEFFAPLRNFAAVYQDRFNAAATAGALESLPPLPPPPPELPVRTVEAQGVSVAFEDVRLVWDPARPPALDGVSFRVPAGETLILAGPSGAGKSSVIDLLLGFVHPTSGRVTLNGADIASLVPQALARLTAWVGQNPTLFAGTIRDNIRFARPEASEHEVEEAARLARLDTVAAALPQGLDTLVGEGGYGLSGGQAQRIAIARAFLRNAPLLLLDEPTVHLDPATEGEVLESLRRLTVGRTVILASHSSAAHSFGGRRLDLRAGRVAD